MARRSVAVHVGKALTGACGPMRAIAPREFDPVSVGIVEIELAVEGPAIDHGKALYRDEHAPNGQSSVQPALIYPGQYTIDLLIGAAPRRGVAPRRSVC
jgi:hypothetical protein